MKVRFGICADAHTEFMHDSVARVEAFLRACEEENCDFAVQLGDFCPPGETNRAAKETILAAVKACRVPLYHTLGNHDMDKNAKADVLQYVGAEKSYYSYDCGGVHFVVLDGCCYADGEAVIDYDHGNYKHAPDDSRISMLSPEALVWLREDLSMARYPAVLFSHQSLIESRASIANAEALRAILREAPQGALLAICGHEHVDRLERCEGVYYYCLNSMSYYWAGRPYDHATFGEEHETAYPMLRYVFPYRDPLFAIVEIDGEEIRIRGRISEIVGATPEQMHFQKQGLVDPITASITDRRLPLHHKE